MAERFNRLFVAPGEPNFFSLPDKLVFEDNVGTYPRVMSLINASKKMSKSDKSIKSVISLIDDPEMIRLKIRKAKTDSLG